MERMRYMEQKTIQLYEIVGNMAERLGTVAEIHDSSMRAIAGLCQDHTTKIATQGAAIRSLQAQTGEIMAQGATLKDLQSQTDKIEAQGATIKNLQAETGIMKQKISELQQVSGNCIRRVSVVADSIDNLLTSNDTMRKGIEG
jgi:uncharacterized protein YukE